MEENLEKIPTVQESKALNNEQKKFNKQIQESLTLVMDSTL